jgi:uncharacterized protein YqjF (DUF2071 family)
MSLTSSSTPAVNRAPVFLRAEWRKLAMANYTIDPLVLEPHLPKGTELDTFNGQHFVSLVGFLFKNTRLKGIPIPFHRNFEEVNLRFYVRHETRDGWRRGVVFIKEIVPRPALTLVANMIYGEPYETMPMRHSWSDSGKEITVKYEWKKKQWHSFSVIAQNSAVPIADKSVEEFITEHYWGYTRLSGHQTSEYGVEHPRWDVYPVKDYHIDVDFERLYGQSFRFLDSAKPSSVLLAEGSEIVVRGGRRL